MQITQKKIGPDDVWASILELSQRQKETDRQIRETGKQQKETARQLKETDKYLKEKFSDLKEHIQETDRQLKETDRQLKETDRQLKETDSYLRDKFSDLKEYVGGIGRNNGDVAETYFYETLANTMRIGEIDFDIIEKNVSKKNKRQNLEGEYDIILTNSESIALVEIKYKLHPNDIDKLVHKKIPVFKKLFPEKKAYKLYVVVAGLTIPADSKKMAFNHGFFVLTQGAGKLNMEYDVIKSY